MSFAFPAAKRLKTTAQFQTVRQKGFVVRTRFFRVGFLAEHFSRFGVVVGKSLGNAVLRNRLKRRLREHFRKNGQLYPRGACVILPQDAAASLEHHNFILQLEQALAKLRREVEKK